MLGDILTVAAFLGGTAYAWLTLKAWRGLGRLVNAKPPSANHPTVSVVVAARDEAVVVGELIDALKDQDYPPGRLQFIIVDDRSQDATASIVKNVSTVDPRFKLVQVSSSNPRFSPKKQALAKGIAAASGEIILLTDADCRPNSGWVSALVAPIAAGADMVIGQARFPANGNSPFWQRLQALDHRAINLTSIGLAAGGTPYTCTSVSLAFRRSFYDAVNGWAGAMRAASGDDEFLLMKAVAAGYKIAAAGSPDSVVNTKPPATLGELWHQRARWGSKGLYYPLSRRIILSGVFLFCLTLTLGLIMFPFGWAPAGLAGVWTVKIALDLMVLSRGGRRFGEPTNWMEFVVLTPIHPLAVVSFVISGIFGGFRWKNDRFNRHGGVDG